MSNPRIIQNNGQKLYLKLTQGAGAGINQLTGDVLAGPGIGAQLASLAAVNSNVGTWGDSTHVPQIVVDAKGRITSVGNVAISGGGGSVATSMPIASTLGVLDNGTDQTSNLNTIFSNPAYAGVVVDFTNPGAITINGTVNCQGKVIVFVSGSFFTGTGTLNNFIQAAGSRQKCYDIGTSGTPALTVNPVGTTTGWISPWAFGAKDDGTDVARYFQATIDCCIRNGGKVNTIYTPPGTYVCGAPLIEYSWSGSQYIFHQITYIGDETFSSADGDGSILNFSSRKNSFGIGIQAGKGSTIKNMKFIGGFSPPFTTAYAFYNTPFASFTDGVSRDTQYSPNSAVVVDPFGPSVPADGGWPGNDAYGNALTGYYRGSSTSGSTGVTLEDIFMTNWVVGIICSPNGQTANAELLSVWKIQVTNMKLCFASCQSQEKLNIVRHIQSWGNTHTIFATGIYGAGSPGSWLVEDVNIAGFSNTFINDNQTGYFPSFFSNIYAESLGTIGIIQSNNGTLISKATFNFATYIDAGSYMAGQIGGQGATFHGCQFRMLGLGKPVTINALNGPLFFRDCSFDTPPFFNQEYPLGFCAFSNCVVANSGYMLNPMDMQTVTTASLSDTFAYGNIKIKVGSPTATSRVYNIKSSVPAIRMPINRTTANYLVTTSVSGGFTQAVITCGADELNRVFVGDVICAETGGVGAGIQIMGIVTAAGGGTFTITYIPAWVVSGTHYYLYVWLQLKNVSFVGDQTSGSNQITNVTLIDGDLVNFNSTGQWGGLLITAGFKQTDAWGYNMVRIIGWNPGTSTLTVDRQSTANLTKLLYTNTDATLDPGTPTIVPGVAAGSTPTVSITKGNDKNMQVSILTGTGTTTGLLATITFSLPFPGGHIPCISFSPANGNAAALSGATEVFMDSANPSTFTINTGSSAIGAGTTFLWNIDCN